MSFWFIVKTEEDDHDCFSFVSYLDYHYDTDVESCNMSEYSNECVLFFNNELTVDRAVKYLNLNKEGCFTYHKIENLERCLHLINPEPKYPELKKFMDLVKATLENKPEFVCGLCHYWSRQYNDIDPYKLWVFYRRVTDCREDSLGKHGTWNEKRIDYCKWILNNLPRMYENFLLFIRKE